MIEERKFVVNGRGSESPRTYQGSREPAPAGLWIVLTVYCTSGDRLFLGFQQSWDAKNWQQLGEPESYGVGCQNWCVWPKPGMPMRMAFWTAMRRCAIVDFQVFDNGRSRSA
ncbi:MAG: hypothetical protein FD180_3149 [Planctomycetota bacterium]|nr:MAG: hypothetical protein FD180_3149 [Planctomycetota bacterium]